MSADQQYLSGRIESLESENASLSEQIKLLVRVEKRLYATQFSLEHQLRRIRALNNLALAVMPTSSPVAILSRAIELLCPQFAAQAAVAVLYPCPGEPSGLCWEIDGRVEAVAVPAQLEARPQIEATNRSYLVPRDACPGTLAPVVAWLNEFAHRLPGHLHGWLYRDVVLSIGDDAAAIRAIVALRSATIADPLSVAGEADLPLFEVACRHVSRTIEIAVLHTTLEQRVADRTLALRDSNEQLAESLQRLKGTQRELVEASRKAGMSEIATSVLHNVGNVLNSVNVSAGIVSKQVEQLNTMRITKVTEMLRQHRDDLPRFFAEAPRAASFLAYLDAIAIAASNDRQSILDELISLQRNIDHIKTIVMLQQDLTNTNRGVIEPLSLAEVIEDALRVDGLACERSETTVERELETLTAVVADRHRILQILINLLSNARHAVAYRPPEQRRVVVRLAKLGDEHIIEVEDNGCGIASENLDRVFNLGFTTRADGHGFGLHSSACAALELGGALSCHSEGPDRGARFRLRLPLASPRL